MMIPDSERMRFESLMLAHADRFGMAPEEYLRKVWYHEEATKVGEFVAMSFLDELIPLLPPPTGGTDEGEEDELA